MCVKLLNGGTLAIFCCTAGKACLVSYAHQLEQALRQHVHAACCVCLLLMLTITASTLHPDLGPCLMRCA